MADSGLSAFEQRYAQWAERHVRLGAARSYPYAWRLPDLARQADAPARSRAALALAQTLYAMGRFGEALAALADAGPAPAALELQARCLWLQGDDDGARARLGRIAYPDSLDGLRARAGFAQLEGDPTGAAAPILAYGAAAAGQGEHGAWATLLSHWLDPEADPARPHRALAWLRAHRPAASAEGEAMFALARLRAEPAAALVWLDHALAQGEHYGQHHLKARLMLGKVRALEAGGNLGVAAKFQALARETAQRQGAWRYLQAMAP